MAIAYIAQTSKNDDAADDSRIESQLERGAAANNSTERSNALDTQTDPTSEEIATQNLAEPVIDLESALTSQRSSPASKSTQATSDGSLIAEPDSRSDNNSGSTSNNDNSDARNSVPQFWKLASSSFGSTVGDVIELSSDYQQVWDGSASARLRPKRIIDPRETAGIVQLIDAGFFAGNRVRYSGYLQIEGQSGIEPSSAFLWIRADNADGKLVAFQNTIGRFQLQNSAWQEIEIVIDIPVEASVIFYGASLLGNGSVWIDSLSLNKVTESTPATSTPDARPIYNRIPSADEVLGSPTNLDFEETRGVSRQ